MSTKVYHLYVNPTASEQVGHFLAKQGLVAESETSVLKFKGKKYPSWIVVGEDHISQIRQCVRDLPDIFKDVHLFEQEEGQGRNASDVTFMIKKGHVIRDTVIRAVGTRGVRGQGPSRDKLIKRAG